MCKYVILILIPWRKKKKKEKEKKSRVITFYVYFSRTVLCTNYAMSYDYSDPFIYAGLCKLMHMLGFSGSRVN